MRHIIRTTGAVSEPYPRTTAGDAVITYENGASHKVSRSPAAELADLHRQLLRTVDWDLIVQECARRGHQVCLHQICRFSTDRPPSGYPPLGDDDLPFDAGKDTRG